MHIMHRKIIMIILSVSCSVERHCKNLTATDAPENGGLVCHWYRKEKSVQCAVRCNKGYEFTSSASDYETCSASTGFQWSFRNRDKTAAIPPCLGNYYNLLKVCI